MSDIHFMYGSIIENDCFGIAPKEDDKVCPDCPARETCREIVAKAEDQDIVAKLSEEVSAAKSKPMDILTETFEESIEEVKAPEEFNTLVTPYINFLKTIDTFEFVDKGLQGMAVNRKAKLFLNVKSYKKENTNFYIVFTAKAKGIKGVTEHRASAAYTQQVYRGSDFKELIDITNQYYAIIKGE